LYQSPILANAIDSLHESIRYLNHRTDCENPVKHSILAAYQAIELLLKEALHNTHESLIYHNLNQPISPDSRTVSLLDAITRLANLEISLEESDVRLIRRFAARRNRIQHLEYQEEDYDRSLVGEAYDFAFRFVDNHLSLILERYMINELYIEMMGEIGRYEEVVEDRTEDAQEYIAGLSPEERASVVLVRCPLCDQETLVVHEGKQGYCCICQTNLPVVRCKTCGTYVLEHDIRGEKCWHCVKKHSPIGE